MGPLACSRGAVPVPAHQSWKRLRPQRAQAPALSGGSGDWEEQGLPPVTQPARAGAVTALFSHRPQVLCLLRKGAVLNGRDLVKKVIEGRVGCENPAPGGSGG